MYAVWMIGKGAQPGLCTGVCHNYPFPEYQEFTNITQAKFIFWGEDNHRTVRFIVERI
jgi:hypothetical protein